MGNKGWAGFFTGSGIADNSIFESNVNSQELLELWQNDNAVSSWGSLLENSLDISGDTEKVLEPWRVMELKLNPFSGSVNGLSEAGTDESTYMSENDEASKSVRDVSSKSSGIEQSQTGAENAGLEIKQAVSELRAGGEVSGKQGLYRTSVESGVVTAEIPENTPKNALMAKYFPDKSSTFDAGRQEEIYRKARETAYRNEEKRRKFDEYRKIVSESELDETAQMAAVDRKDAENIEPYLKRRIELAGDLIGLREKLDKDIAASSDPGRYYTVFDAEKFISENSASGEYTPEDVGILKEDLELRIYEEGSRLAEIQKMKKVGKMNYSDYQQERMMNNDYISSEDKERIIRRHGDTERTKEAYARAVKSIDYELLDSVEEEAYKENGCGKAGLIAGQEARNRALHEEVEKKTAENLQHMAEEEQVLEGFFGKFATYSEVYKFSDRRYDEEIAGLLGGKELKPARTRELRELVKKEVELRYPERDHNYVNTRKQEIIEGLDISIKGYYPMASQEIYDLLEGERWKNGTGELGYDSKAVQQASEILFRKFLKGIPGGEYFEGEEYEALKERFCEVIDLPMYLNNTINPVRKKEIDKQFEGISGRYVRGEGEMKAYRDCTDKELKKNGVMEYPYDINNVELNINIDRLIKSISNNKTISEWEKKKCIEYIERKCIAEKYDVIFGEMKADNLAFMRNKRRWQNSQIMETYNVNKPQMGYLDGGYITVADDVVYFLGDIKNIMFSKEKSWNNLRKKSSENDRMNRISFAAWVAADKEYKEEMIASGVLSPFVANIEIALKTVTLNIFTGGLIDIENAYTNYQQSGMADEEICELMGQKYVETTGQFLFQEFMSLPTSSYRKIPSIIFTGYNLWMNYDISKYGDKIYRPE